MRKILAAVLALMLLSFVFAAAAFTDCDCTTVTGIPMAVDFSVDVLFDEAGRPQIVTDYPFEKTGAEEMTLTYGVNGEEVFILNYKFRSKTTRVGGRNPQLLGSDSDAAAYRAIQDGKVTLEDEVIIHTTRYSSEADWFLYYSRSEKRYTRYSEKTYAQAANAMGSGGTDRSVYYFLDEIDSASVTRRLDDADLFMEYNRYGDMTSAVVMSFSPTRADYYYNASTGLFDGHPITDFGFTEADLETEPLAFVGDKTATLVSVPEDIPAAQTADRSTFGMTGGLLAGLMIGITLFYLFRRKKKEPAEPVKAETPVSTDSAPAQEEIYETPKTFSAGK